MWVSIFANFLVSLVTPVTLAGVFGECYRSRQESDKRAEETRGRQEAGKRQTKQGQAEEETGSSSQYNSSSRIIVVLVPHK